MVAGDVGPYVGTESFVAFPLPHDGQVGPALLDAETRQTSFGVLIPRVLQRVLQQPHAGALVPPRVRQQRPRLSFDTNESLPVSWASPRRLARHLSWLTDDAPIRINHRFGRLHPIWIAQPIINRINTTSRRHDSRPQSQSQSQSKR